MIKQGRAWRHAPPPVEAATALPVERVEAPGGDLLFDLVFAAEEFVGGGCFVMEKRLVPREGHVRSNGTPKPAAAWPGRLQREVDCQVTTLCQFAKQRRVLLIDGWRGDRCALKHGWLSTIGLP